MKLSLLSLLLLLLVSCVFTSGVKSEKFEAASSSLDERIETASIEDYIIALPPFAYHEASVDQFAQQVRASRFLLDENRGKGSDYLFVGGDGCWPSKEFKFDREKRTLKIRVYQWEPGTKDYSETMRRVPGGWMRGSRVEIDTGD
jgi:hypothetical protein